MRLLALTLLALSASGPAPADIPQPVPIPLANPGFEADLGAEWERASEGGGTFTRDPQTACTGAASARASGTKGWAGFFTGPGHRVPVRPGEQFKLAAWMRLKDATGQTYLSIDGYRGGEFAGILSQSQPAQGTLDGWTYRYVLATVPADGSVTHIRAGLRSEGNTGAAWFDDVRLWRLPSDVPHVTEPPGKPPRGKITVAGGHLVGEDGRRARLWGVNVYEEVLRPYREQTYIARRIREMGFNAVRVWWHDNVIIDTKARTPAGEATSLVHRDSRQGDGSTLDHMDYFVYCAEREGLYLYMNFDRMTTGVFGPGDYDVLPGAGPEDERAWKEAVVALQPKGRTDEHVYFVDPRLGEAHARHVGRIVSRRNPYTGKRYADDPYVSLWELTNENGFIEALLSGGFTKWPEYFQGVLRGRWNAWLRDRYRDDAALAAAWGKLAEGESLARGSVACAPILSQAKEFPEARMADFSRFVYDLQIGYSRRLQEIVKRSGSAAARTPVGWNTMGQHKHRLYYPATHGDVVTVGDYQRGPVNPDREARRISPGFKGWYNLSYATVKDKPMVVYEVNTIKPDYWRADYPMMMAAFASAHDWDGVFWYTWSDGTVRDQLHSDAYTTHGVVYAAPSHYWHGIVISTDEALLASLRLAGRLFTGFAIPDAPDPVTITVGARDLLGSKLWVGDIDIPYPEDAPGPYPRAFAMQLTDWAHTCRYVYDMNRERSSVTRPLLSRMPQPCSPVPGLTYDWERGTLKVDGDRAKAIVGFVGDGESFAGGVRLRVTGKHDPDFVCFGIATEEDRPLDQARRAVLVLTTYGENQGRTLWEEPAKVPGDAPLFAKLVRGRGWGPALLARPAARIDLGRPWHWRMLGFGMNVLSEGRGATLEIPEGTPLFAVELWQ